ncbi:MAG: regulatory particle non-ATPase [Bogoriella megaspora]|nr:MAG: regulatory particle non-ATPase [Bogoriella megaspora]
MSSFYIRNRIFERWLGSKVEDKQAPQAEASEAAETGRQDRGQGKHRKLRASASHSQTATPSPYHPISPPRLAPPTLDSAAQLFRTCLPIPPTSKSTPKPTPAAMADQELSSILKQLYQSLDSHNYSQSPALLSRAKICLLKLNALIPSPQASQQLLFAARQTLELGALVSIRLQDPEAFTRYFQQLQPFYNLPSEVLSLEGSNASKVTGLYLLLLLSQGDYAGFHTTLEGLETQAQQQAEGQARKSRQGKAKGLEDDAFIQYPIRLEQALMEGSYDRVWGETKSERVPSEEFAIFSDVLIGTIRSEIASCSEKAYPSLPISNAKNLLFLDSEGSVVKFAQERGWAVKDGRIYFPEAEAEQYGTEKDILATSGQVIENTLGYARELETIV